MKYNLVRQSRKTVGIYIKNGGVEIRSPYKMSVSEIDKLIASKKMNYVKTCRFTGKTGEKTGVCRFLRFNVALAGHRISFTGRQRLHADMAG